MNRVIIATEIEINEDFIPNSNVTYTIYWDFKMKMFVCVKDKNRRRWVSYDECPKEIYYTLDKPIEDFTRDEKIAILAYRGLKLKEGFELGDIFIEKSYITLVDNSPDWVKKQLKDLEEVSLICENKLKYLTSKETKMKNYQVIIGIDTPNLNETELTKLKQIIFKAIPSGLLVNNYEEAVTLKKVEVRDKDGDFIKDIDISYLNC